jgi:DNA primase
MITPDTIQRVRDAARIEEVVGDFVRLRRRGSNLIGLCPFHNEKSPSFSVSPAKGIYKCFGCGKAGDSLRFLMDIDQLSYPDAIRKLADKYGIEIEEREQSPEEQEQAQIKETLFQVNEVVAQWFQEQMWETEEGQIAALSYFRERGFTDETIRTFRLGYAPKSWTGLGDFAKEGVQRRVPANPGVDIKIGTENRCVPRAGYVSYSWNQWPGAWVWGALFGKKRELTQVHQQSRI